MAVVAIVSGCGRVDFAPHADASGEGLPVTDGAIDPTLLVWLEMDTPAAGQLADSSGNGHHARCTACPTSTTGVRGGAYLFDGVAQIAQIAHDPAFDLQTATVALWLRLDAMPVMYLNAFGRPYGAGNLDSWEIWGSNLLEIGAGGNSVSNEYTHSALTLGQWTHVAAVWSAGTITQYRDGSVVDANPFDVAYDSQDLVVGGDFNSMTPVNFWNGALDDVRLYSRALSQAEIQALATP
jgi:hypothetical protein